MSDIDWLAVQMVVDGYRLALKPGEKKAVMRRIEPKLLLAHENGPYPPPGKIRARDVAERMGMSKRNVERLVADLPPAVKGKCPVCREPMWVLKDTNVVEAHGNPINEECEMSGRLMPSPPRGLAALRPDLYAWLVSA